MMKLHGYLAAGFLSVCLLASPGLADVWVTGPSHRVLRNEKPRRAPALFDSASKTVRLYAARNEFVSFQIVFPGPMSNVDVDTFSLAGPNGTTLGHVELFREHYMKHVAVSQYDGKRPIPDAAYMEQKRRSMNAPREYPVQMVPLRAPRRGAPFNVDAGQNEVVWVDIFVPEGSPAGTYRGSFKAGNETLRIELEVWNFTLPSVSHFPNWVYVGPEQITWGYHKVPRDLSGMMPTFDSYFQMAHNHRVSLMETMEYNTKYFKAADRGFYDYYTGKAFRGPFAAGFGYELLPLGRSFGDMGDLIASEKWENRAFAYLADEPGSKDAYETVLQRGKAVREQSRGRIQRFVTEQFVPSQPDWPSLDPEVDIFCSGGIHPDNVRKVEAKGNAVWTYNVGHAGAQTTDAPGPAMRTHAWAGFITGSRAWFLWDGVYVVDKHNRWRNERRAINNNPAKYRTDVWNTALNFDEATKPWKNGKLYPEKWALRLNGDGLLFYPGMDVGLDEAIGCLRLKNIRQGAQDFEYLYLLEKMGRKGAALAVARKLIPATAASPESRDGQAGKVRFDYEKDPLAWDAARIRLGEMLNEIGDRALRAKIKPYNQYPNPVGHPDYYGGKRY